MQLYPHIKVVQGRSGLSRIVRLPKHVLVAAQPHSVSRAEIEKLNRVYKNIPGALRDKAVAKALAKGRNAVSARIRKEARRSFDVQHYKKAKKDYGVLKSIKGKAGRREKPFRYTRVGGKGAMHARILQSWYNFIRRGWNLAGPKRDEAILKELKKNQPEVIDEAWRRGKAGIPASK